MSSWISSTRMAIGAVAMSGVVIDAPPIVRSVIGHIAKDFDQWMASQPGYQKVVIARIIRNVIER